MIQNSSNTIYEAVIEPGEYNVQLVNGSEISNVKEKIKLTRGENRFVLDITRNNTLVDEHTYRDVKKSSSSGKLRNDASQATASGVQQNNAKTGSNVGKIRPDTTDSMVSDFGESNTRIGSADYKTRPGSASMNKTQDNYQS